MPIVLDGSTGITTPGLSNSGADSAASQTLSGNLTFTGTGNRILGDFSNATVANRLMFQTSTVNGASDVGFLPNGTGNVSIIKAYNNSDPTNANLVALTITTAEARLTSGLSGTGTYLPMTFYTGGSERMRIDTSGNVGIGVNTPFSRVHIADSNSTGTITLGGAPTTGYYSQIFQNGPLNSLDIISNGDQAYRASLGTNNGTGIIRFFTAGLTTGNTERMRISSSGLITTNIEGSATLYAAYSARAWVNFNGTGTIAIRGSGNVSSIGDGGAGAYTVNFTTAMPDANFNAVSAISHAGGVTRSVSGTVEGYATSSVTINTGYSSTLYDPTNVNVTIFR